MEEASGAVWLPGARGVVGEGTGLVPAPACGEVGGLWIGISRAVGWESGGQEGGQVGRELSGRIPSVWRRGRGSSGTGRARIRPRRVVGDRTAGIVLASHPHAMNAEYEPAGRKTHKPCGRVGAARSSSLADVM